jgi:hypothetical protein
MDEINIGPRHDLRLPSRRWLVVVAAHPRPVQLIFTSPRVGSVGLSSTW